MLSFFCRKHCALPGVYIFFASTELLLLFTFALYGFFAFISRLACCLLDATKAGDNIRLQSYDLSAISNSRTELLVTRHGLSLLSHTALGSQIE